MAISVRNMFCIGAAAVALSGAGAGVQILLPSGSAVADTCTNDIGNNATVSFCADLVDIVGEILTPGMPDRGPGNLTPNLATCLGWDGRWVESDTCS